MQWSLSIQHENMEQTKSFLNPSVVIVSLPIDDGVTANMVKKTLQVSQCNPYGKLQNIYGCCQYGCECVCVCVYKSR